MVVNQLLGHLWTIAPSLRHRAQPWTAPPAEPWWTTLEDPDLGTLELQGALHRNGAVRARALCVAVHGLGGSMDSHYMIRTARAALAAGVDCLRLALRGADRRGVDFYHAALTADLEATLRSPALAGYRDVYVFGYSLGGHLALSYALRPSDPRLRAVASVCAPLDLAAAGVAIDHPRAAVYCGHVLSGLKQIYAEVARRRPVPTPVASVRQVRTIRAWDRLAVVPRFRFASVDDYYQRTSVGPRLAGAQVPALVVSARADPMIPAATIAPHVERLPPGRVTHRWLDRGGHVGFPDGVRLGLGEAPPGVPAQVLGWLQQQA